MDRGLERDLVTLSGVTFRGTELHQSRGVVAVALGDLRYPAGMHLEIVLLYVLIIT
jgi:hypothetical protein